MCALFWVIPRRLNFICRRFGTLCPIFIDRYEGSTYEDGTDRNVDIQNADAGLLPRRKQTTFRTRRKFENQEDLFRLFCDVARLSRSPQGSTVHA